MKSCRHFISRSMIVKPDVSKSLQNRLFIIPISFPGLLLSQRCRERRSPRNEVVSTLDSSRKMKIYFSFFSTRRKEIVGMGTLRMVSERHTSSLDITAKLKVIHKVHSSTGDAWQWKSVPFIVFT